MKTLFIAIALTFVLIPSLAFAQAVEPSEGLGGTGAPAPAPSAGGSEPPPGDPTYMPAGSMSPAQQMPGPSQTFRPLAGVPGITNLGDISMSQFLNALYRTLIVIGALIAVLKITIAGLKYMGSDNFGSKASAKEDITAALLGLLILLATVLIINTILGSVNLNVLQGPPIPLPQQSPTPFDPGGGTTGIALKKEAGCYQLSGNGAQCPSGKTGAISGNQVSCADAASIPALPNQGSFKLVTEAQCVQTMNGNPNAVNGNMGKMIEEGKQVLGYVQIPTSQARDRQAKARELEADCKAGGGSQVVIVGAPSTAVISGVTTPTYGFVCVK
jgi:hypothetical protein